MRYRGISQRDFLFFGLSQIEEETNARKKGAFLMVPGASHNRLEANGKMLDHLSCFGLTMLV